MRQRLSDLALLAAVLVTVAPAALTLAILAAFERERVPKRRGWCPR